MDENVTVANNYTASPVSENGTIKATEAPEDPDEYLNDVAKKLTLYIQPVITLGGLMGNVIMFMVMQVRTVAWVSYQIRKIAGWACVGNAGNVFPAADFEGNR